MDNFTIEELNLRIRHQEGRIHSLKSVEGVVGLKIQREFDKLKELKNARERKYENN